MVVLGLILLVVVVAGVLWFASYAWGPQESGWPDQRRGGTRTTFRPAWPFWVIAAVLLALVVVILRGRGIPLLVLFAPLLWMWGRTRYRCGTCGEPISPRAEACLGCGAPRN